MPNLNQTLAHESNTAAQPVVREINGDFAGSLETDENLVIQGTVADGASLETSGQLEIHGDVNAASLKVGGSAILHGKFDGKRLAKCSAGKDFQSGALNDVLQLMAYGDIAVSNDVTHCKVVAGGIVKVKGRVVGGRVQANGGLVCLHLGNEEGDSTIVEAGDCGASELVLVHLKREIDLLRKQSNELKERVQPLMHDLQRFSPQQRERATELLATASEIDSRADAYDQRYQELQTTLTKVVRSCVYVVKVLHPGVTVRMRDAEASVKREIHGPLTVHCEGSGKSAHIFVTIQASGLRVPLTTTECLAA